MPPPDVGEPHFARAEQQRETDATTRSRFQDSHFIATERPELLLMHLSIPKHLLSTFCVSSSHLPSP